MRLREGELFAGYRVLRQLGRGGMAYVYLAEEAGVNRQVALKLLPEDVADDAQAVQRFEQEAQTVAGLEHPNIVPLYRHGIERGAPWMALRLVRGGDLAERLQRPLAVAEGLQIFRQIAQALDFAHRMQVIHRDLKPGNVLLSRDEGGETHAYLADFGIAKLLAGSARVRTGTGGILGTPQYMAPEAARGEVLGPAADIYALGVMAFEWQTGKVPFDADTPLAVLYKQISDPPPEALLRDLPADVARVLRLALHKDAKARPASAVALVDQLAMALGASPARPAPVAPTARVEPAARFPNPPVAPAPVPTARAEPAEARDRIRKAAPPPSAATPVSPSTKSTGLHWAAGLGFTGIVGLALWAGNQPGPVPTGEVRPVSAPAVSTSPASPAPAPSPSSAPPTPSAVVPQTSDGVVRVPVGGALPAEGVPFRHALKGGGVGPEMVLLPGGRFRMGSPETEKDRSSDEGPVREVTIPSFAMGVTELTFADWDLCASRGGCGGHEPGDEGWGRGDRPVINVSWEDAQGYVAWLKAETGAGYRLPSESEWEYAARAGTQTAYWWGSGIDRSRANYGTEECCDGKAEGADRWEYTAPVKSFAVNGFGLYDTSGNVFEWVEDCYVASYARAPADGRAVEKGDCEARGLRGASWIFAPAWLRSASRDGVTPSYRNSFRGFRVALDR